MIEFTQKQGTMTSNNESYASNSSPNTLKVAAIVVTPISNIGIESVREFIPSCPDDLKPKLGQEFKDLQEATAFYKRYASTCGFNTRLGTTKARKNDPKTFTWLARRQAHMVRVQQGIPISEFGVLVDMIRVPDWAFEAAGLEMRGMGQDAAPYQPGLYYTSAQREALEALIQELPKFMLKAVPTDCSECPICLEEFRVGNEVRGLPCAHNFHVECIDQWLRLSPKCPRCRCSVFPNLDLSGLSNLRPDSKRERSSSTVVTATQSVRGQTPSQRYRLRLQGFLQPIRSVNGRSSNEFQTALPLAENGRQPTNPVPEHIVDLTSSAASSH